MKKSAEKKIKIGMPEQKNRVRYKAKMHDEYLLLISKAGPAAVSFISP